MSPPGISIDVRYPNRPPVPDQIDDLAIDLSRLCTAIHDTACGIGLAAAHAVLRLAVTPAADEDEQMIKHEALADAAKALACAGFGHVRELIDVALAFDVPAGCLQRGNGLVQ